MKNTNLTSEEQQEMFGYFDTCANYFGGDQLNQVETNYYSNDKVGFLNWLKRASKKISKVGYYGQTYVINGRFVTAQGNI